MSQFTMKGAGAKEDNIEGVDEEEDASSCGYGRWRPECLRKMTNAKWLLAVICGFTFVQGWVVNGINNVNTSTIERRFDMQSTQVAWITSSYDIASGVLGILMGYLGAFHHKGVMMTVGAGVMALGSFIMFSPHLFVGEYEFNTREDGHCDVFGNRTEDGCGSGSSVSNYLYVFILGQICHAVGGTAVFNTGLTLLDDNVKNTDTPLYVGIMHSFSALGPAIAFVAGGAFLNIYVDIGRVNLDNITISPGDPGWVGAWWIGFLVSGICGITVTILMACFPRDLPEARRLRALKQSEAYAGAGEDEMARDNFGRKWSDVLLSLKVIFSNPSWLFLTAAATVESGAVNSFATFLPKVLQFQFSLTAGGAALFAGLLTVPGAAGGQLLGGIIPKCWKMRLRGLLLSMTACSLIGLALSFSFFIRCEMPKIAGVNVAYFNSSIELETEALYNKCNSRCHCTTREFEPLCGHDGVQYFSRCHAECDNVTEIEDGKNVYSGCACVPEVDNPDTWQAEDGVCEEDCTLQFVVFLVLLFILMLVTFMVNTIGHAATIRCVPEKQRGFAYGIQSFIVRILGNVPFPIILGAVFDNSCLVWQERCEETAACWIYDTDSMSFKLAFLLAVVKAFSFVAFLGSYIAYKPPKDFVIDTKEIDCDKDANGGSDVCVNTAQDQSDYCEPGYLNNVFQNSPMVEKKQASLDYEVTKL